MTNTGRYTHDTVLAGLLAEGHYVPSATRHPGTRELFAWDIDVSGILPRLRVTVSDPQGSGRRDFEWDLLSVDPEQICGN